MLSLMVASFFLAKYCRTIHLTFSIRMRRRLATIPMEIMGFASWAGYSVPYRRNSTFRSIKLFSCLIIFIFFNFKLKGLGAIIDK